MAARYTIYAGVPIESALMGYEQNRSGRLNQIVADWHVMNAESPITTEQSQALHAQHAAKRASELSEKFTIYAGAPIVEALKGYEKTRSGRLNQIVEEYQMLVTHHMPAFSVADWRLLCDVLEYAHLDSPHELRLMWALLAEDARTVHLSDSVRALTLSQLIALREVLRRCWVAQENSAETFDAEKRLRDLGARIFPNG